jgi:large subunit ribosomal protein L15
MLKKLESEMFLSEIRPSKGSVKKPKRIGRGPGSGHGKTSGRGMNGQGSRSGFSLPPGFEGGQMPLQRRLPKRGFTNIFKKEWQIVHLSNLDRIFESGAIIDKKALKEVNLIKDLEKPVKILSRGETKKAFTVKVEGFSKSAMDAITAAGGKVEKI